MKFPGSTDMGSMDLSTQCKTTEITGKART